jgi:hypothetical protein
MQPGTTPQRPSEEGRLNGPSRADDRHLTGEGMTTEIRALIQRMGDYETLGWDTKDPEPFLSMIHPDMAWPFAPNADAHDPVDWHFIMGRFDEDQWRRDYQVLFAAHDLIHNNRNTVKIEVAPTEDAAFAVVDIDTLWRNKETGTDFHWKGRVCKIYSKLRTGEWKFYWQTSALNYPIRESSGGTGHERRGT